jgi:signal transduction histidine kinase
VVQRNALRLQGLLADLLLIGQVADGTLELQMGPADVAAIAREAVEAARVSAERAGIALTADLPERLPVRADDQRLRQVVDNLLSNAIKYSRSGDAATVAARREDDRIVIEVADTGIGIAPDELDHVFGRFFRGGEAIERQITGTGLGLSIVGSIVAAHDGTVTAESEQGRGTTFRVTLPAPS